MNKKIIKVGKKINKKRGSETIESMLIIAVGVALAILVFYPELISFITIMIRNLSTFTNNFMLDLMG